MRGSGTAQGIDVATVPVIAGLSAVLGGNTAMSRGVVEAATEATEGGVAVANSVVASGGVVQYEEGAVEGPEGPEGERPA